MATLLTDGYTGDDKKALYNQGQKIQVVKAQVTIAAGDDDGDVIILARNLPLGAIVTGLMLKKAIANITNGTDYDIGFYRAAGADGDALGAAIDADILVDGIDLSSGWAVGDIIGEGLTWDGTKTIGELLSLQADKAPQGGVHLCITANTIGTAAGYIDMEVEIAMAG